MKLIALAVMLSMSIAFADSSHAADLAPHFGFVAPEFAPIQTIDMSQFWGPAGLQETGTNYYTSGGPTAASPNWKRFDPESPYYQIWVGAYVIDNFAYAFEWNKRNLNVTDIPNSIQRLILLSSVDQIAWLTGFRDPHPNAAVQPNSVEVVKEGPRQFAMYLRYNTDSDLGYPDPLFGFYPGYSMFADLVEANAPIVYEAIVRFTYDDAHHNMLVRYASNCHWSLRDGTKRRTPLEVQVQQGLMTLAIKFQEQRRIRATNRTRDSTRWSPDWKRSLAFRKNLPEQ